MKRNLKTTGRVLRATPLLRDATLRAMRVLAWRRLVTTYGGYLGLVPAGAIVGDVVAMITGCDVPLLLRPAKGETHKIHFNRRMLRSRCNVWRGDGVFRAGEI